MYVFQLAATLTPAYTFNLQGWTAKRFIPLCKTINKESWKKVWWPRGQDPDPPKVLSPDWYAMPTCRCIIMGAIHQELEGSWFGSWLMSLAQPQVSLLLSFYTQAVETQQTTETSMVLSRWSDYLAVSHLFFWVGTASVGLKFVYKSSFHNVRNVINRWGTFVTLRVGNLKRSGW